MKVLQSCCIILSLNCDLPLLRELGGKGLHASYSQVKYAESRKKACIYPVGASEHRVGFELRHQTFQNSSGDISDPFFLPLVKGTCTVGICEFELADANTEKKNSKENSLNEYCALQNGKIPAYNVGLQPHFNRPPNYCVNRIWNMMFIALQNYSTS